MADYKLSYTAEEVDELLTKVKGGVCLPVVELETVATPDGVELTAEDVAKIEALEGSTCIIKCNADMDGEQMRIVAPMPLFRIGDVYLYCCNVSGIILGISNENGTWIVSFSNAI